MAEMMNGSFWHIVDYRDISVANTYAFVMPEGIRRESISAMLQPVLLRDANNLADWSYHWMVKDN